MITFVDWLMERRKRRRFKPPVSLRKYTSTELVMLGMSQQLHQLADRVSPQEMLDLLEPYIEAAKGQLIHEKVERGDYPGPTKYHVGESYKD